MYFRVDPKIFEKYPNLKIGVILIKGVNNARRISSVESLLRGICAQRAKEFSDKNPESEPKLAIWNTAYESFGIDPKKITPSINRLIKKIKSDKEIPHINPVSDLHNYFALKYLLPVRSEDMDWLCGDLNLTFTDGGEPFRPANSIEIKKAKADEVAYKDSGGITCRFWNYRECERTKLTDRTVNAAIFIEDLSKMQLDEFDAILQDMQSAIIKYIGGQIEPYILTQEGNLIDLGIEGRRNADDSRVPQQEKVHFERLKT